MSSQMSQQYAFRSQKSLGIVGGSPEYELVKGFDAPTATARTYSYSPDGRLFAYVLPDCVRIHYAENAELLRELALKNIIEVSFSPRGTYISTWERLVKLEDGAQHKNLRVFSVSTGEELAQFTQKGLEGWDLQYTISESHAIRLVGQEVQVFHPAEWSKGVVDKVKVEGVTSIALSPGLNPSVAAFVAEKNGQPATIRIYSLLSLASPPTCQRSTFRAEHAQFKWNTIGTQVLALVRTDVDATNKSYYGETRLYLLSAAGNFDCHVAMPKEGPIHDFSWSPNSREFGVICGFTPTKTVIFDSRVKALHDFGTAPQNYIAFSPQGRLIALAGFGNMSGKLNIYDRRTLQKITSIDAPNTTFCEWSPCGRFLLTATLSPRLRVDNGIKIWHCSGQLMHVQLVDELYQASWRPIPVDAVAQFPQAIPPAPAPNPSVELYKADAKPTPTKPVGAYRPPGARGLEAPKIFKREDEGGEEQSGSGSTTPQRPYSRSPGPNGHGNHPNGYSGRGDRGRGRYVPGAAPSPSPVRQEGGGEKKGAKKQKGKGKKQDRSANASGTATPVGDEGAKPLKEINIEVVQAAAEPDLTPVTPGGADASGLDPTAKKVRNLNKKLKAIEELKEKKKRGERLEVTQIKKMECEADIRQELAALQVQPSNPGSD